VLAELAVAVEELVLLELQIQEAVEVAIVGLLLLVVVLVVQE